MSARERLRSVAVLGAGQVALLAACAIARTLPGTSVRVLHAPVCDDALADQAHTTLPTLARLHERIGMDEPGMMARAAASHRLATRLIAPDLPAGWMAHGAAADPVPAWAIRSEGGGVATGPAAALAQAGRYAPPSDDPASPLSDIDHALRWSPAAYRARLASLARHLGVTFGEGGDGDPATVDADLVIDAAGQRAVADWIDWSRELPVDRVESATGRPDLSVVDTVELTSDRVRVTSPGRDATRIVTLSRGGAGVAIANGRRQVAWDGRVVAIGDAAAMLPPLGWANLHLAVLAIELLVELLPGRAIDPLERAEWNRRFGRAADATCDFVAAHLAGLPSTHPLAPAQSPLLALRIAEFVRRGRIPYVEEDAVPRDLWIQLLTATGITPGISARVAATDPTTRAAARSAHDRRIAQAVAMAEPYPAWLARTHGASA
ncbi:tryptophan 7-halogenase [Sphingomonas sp. CFBP 13720]|uniref:tryptophan 7-halogenase n=1 Tax=Sphingomonas sp. CFBP 13720 TaxID=2775302 RepID=UPI0017844937|nr:tryptophan 7-halogenase [Sphingomonas sp. CFBP 13720]MBD8678604.1 tryptophan 7-halogenase [Sphingomonas sp. CFBP 13720]